MTVKIKKNTFEYMKKTRGEWTINPCTRVEGNTLKDKKKRRQNDKKLIKYGIEE